MILNNAPQDQAVLSNVGQIGEFRIRNSAKAFSILSSGLYANKIRAIIRELSCNAVDSHVAAGKDETPFDVHLPNQLEPWFSIRDYGTGLSHDQVTNIYTTYFESTKTDSNAFIGALGLGSKSPFSYTDNFTVTAVKDGRKGIYTAFINDQGVPSIALMQEETSTEPNGVEVKFSVNDKWDYEKFRAEAQIVYKFFKLRPVVNGYKGFTFVDPVYKTKDIIPGVHWTGREEVSTAVMGNIAYTINVPDADTSLGDLRRLLNCGLIIEFDIGDLDFQASREGLSYVPQTVNAIKRKLLALNSQLALHIAKEADAIQNLWERTYFLGERRNNNLWSVAVEKYVTDTKFPLAESDTNNRRYSFAKTFSISETDLAKKYNLSIKAFSKERSSGSCSTFKATSEYDSTASEYVLKRKFQVTPSTFFVIKDIKAGCLGRARYHWRAKNMKNYTENVYVLEAWDKNRTMHVGQFLKDLMDPPASQIITASNLDKPPKDTTAATKVSILRLEERRRGRWNTEWKWARHGTLSSMDSTKTYYYVEMVNWTPVGMPVDPATLRNNLSQSGILNSDIYAVRKADLDAIRKQSNWVNINDAIKLALTNLNNDVLGVVKRNIEFDSLYQHGAVKHVDVDSPYVKLYNVFKDVKTTDDQKQRAIDYLCKVYGVTSAKADPKPLIEQYKKETGTLWARYPLMKHLGYKVDAKALAEYINMVDNKYNSVV